MRRVGERLGIDRFRGKSTVACLNLAGQAATCRKVACDLSPNWSACAYDVVEDAIDGIFVENSNVSIGMDVHFERFELEAMFVGFVVKGDSSEVGQIRLRANGGVFGDDDRDVVSLVLVGESLNIGQRNRDSALGVPFVVAELGCCPVSLPFLAVLPCHPFTPTILLDLFHPLQLAQLIEFIVKRDPRAGHIRVDLAEAAFTHTPARAVAHEFRAFGFE